MATQRKPNDTEAAPEGAAEPDAVDALAFRGTLTPFDRTLFAGLLADDTSLRSIILPSVEWRKRLDVYATSPRV